MKSALSVLTAIISGIFSFGCGNNRTSTIESVFVDGANLDCSGHQVTVSIVDLGSIAFPSGRITPKDTMIMDEAAQLNREVPKEPGQTQAAVVRFQSGDERVAFLRVRFSQSSVVKHQLATRLISDKWHESYKEAYPVDSGFGGFVDHDAQKRINLALDDKSTQASANLHDQLQEHQVDTWSWANVEILPGLRLLVVSSGFGDGAYKTYYGLNAEGGILEVITDFGWSSPEMNLVLGA